MLWISRSGSPSLSAPVEALRSLAHRLIVEDRSYLRFVDDSRRFVDTVAASEALKARARAIRDEVVQSLTTELATSSGRPVDDPNAHLAASLVMACLTVAFTEAHAEFRRTADAKVAKSTFLAIADRGMDGLVTALAGTPYV